MKKILLSIIFLMPFIINAQTSTQPDLKTIPPTAQIATIEHIVVPMDTMNCYDVCFGSGKNRLMGTNGTAYRFKSASEALFFMNSQGWEFVSTFDDNIFNKQEQVILIKKK